MRGLEAGRASAVNKTVGDHIPIGAPGRGPLTVTAELTRAGSIIEQAPTFKDASDVMLEMKAKKDEH